MICKLCKKNKPLIKAHILPRTFYDFLYPAHDRYPLLMVDANKRTKKRPVGSYDTNILCKDCDSDIGLYDNYGKKVFLEMSVEKYPNSDKAYLIKGVDYKKLSFFIISLLWRDGISSLDEYKLIKLGMYEELMREIIFHKQTKRLIDFPFVVTRFEEGDLGEVASKVIFIPVKVRIDNKLFYIIYLPNCYCVYIKVDRQKMRDKLSNLAFKKDGDLIVLRRGEYKKSKEYQQILDMI